MTVLPTTAKNVRAWARIARQELRLMEELLSEDDYFGAAAHARRAQSAAKTAAGLLDWMQRVES